MSHKVYLAGAYTADTLEEVERNVAKACRAWAQIAAMGGTPFCPHLSHFLVPFVGEDRRFDRDFWLAHDLEWLAVCDTIYMLPGWGASEGARTEHAYARMHGIEICETLDDVRRRLLEVIE